MRKRSGLRHVCVALCATGLLALLGASTASGEKPRFFQGPDIDIVVNGVHVDTPPAQPEVGQTLWGNNGSPDCNPLCDPAKDNKTNHDTLLNPTGGPSGQFYSWRRCNGGGCVETQGKSATQNTYVVQAADAGSQLQLVVWLTNYDCAEERTTDHYRECRYSTTTETAISATVAQPVTVAVAPDALAEGVAGRPYSQTLAASGGTGPYSFSVASGTLPPGLALSAGGALTGTPTQAGSFTFAVRATASAASPGTRTYTLVVHLGLPPSVGNGVTGVAYTQALTSAGASGAVTYSVGAGALPAGLSVSGSQIVGTPTMQGAFTFTLHAVDAAGATGDQPYTVQIAYPSLAVAPNELPEAIRNIRYRVELGATGGTPPYTFKLDHGELPKGFSLSANGVLTGRGSEDGMSKFDFTIAVADKYGAPATKEYELRYYGPAITLEPSRLKPFALGEKVHVKLRAAGGTAPYLFGVLRGRLPDGLRLGPAGVLAGTPTKAGTFRVTVEVTDGKGATETFPLRLVVSA